MNLAPSSDMLIILYSQYFKLNTYMPCQNPVLNLGLWNAPTLFPFTKNTSSAMFISHVIYICYANWQKNDEKLNSKNCIKWSIPLYSLSLANSLPDCIQLQLCYLHLKASKRMRDEPRIEIHGLFDCIHLLISSQFRQDCNKNIQYRHSIPALYAWATWALQYTQPHTQSPTNVLGMGAWIASQLNVAIFAGYVGHWCAWLAFWHVIHERLFSSMYYHVCRFHSCSWQCSIYHLCSVLLAKD